MINRFILAAFYIVSLVGISACGSNKQNPSSSSLFKLLSAEKTGITFSNTLDSSEEFNTYVFRNFYNGGGSAIGDINNDGLKDILLTGNQVPNKLYLNKGEFRFEDITNSAGVSSKGVWSTGVTMADVNGDGLIDIYICKSGPPSGEKRHNELFINNGDLTFTEKAKEYGLDVKGLSIHASFFDYDRDGDLDLYLLNNPIRSLSDLQVKKGLREIAEPEGGNKLFRNETITYKEGDTDFPDNSSKFVDVTQEAGIYSSRIGYGLGASVADINRDAWPDIYISNDFFERDYLYINNGDGTFSERITGTLNDISRSSMGGDIADLNNDGYPEIFVADMLPEEQKRLKSKTNFNDWEKYKQLDNKGYHHQFTRNTLQLNRGKVQTAFMANTSIDKENNNPVYFSETSRYSGLDATDWSWGGLIADFNLDGLKDVYVPNGIYKDLLDQDYINEMSAGRVRSMIKSRENPIMEMIDEMPSRPQSNFMFANRRNLQFEDRAEEWGLAQKSFSNGAAYGDLDNDGDLDLVVNNVNTEAFVYKNRTTEKYPNRNWLEIDLKGISSNKYGVGSQVTLWSKGERWYVEQQPVRGFQSTVDHTLHIGLGDVESVDSLIVEWPDGAVSKRFSLSANKRIKVDHQDSIEDTYKSKSTNTKASGGSVQDSTGAFHVDITRRSDDAHYLTPVNPTDLGISWRHRENEFNDFDQQPLLFHMRSTEGPPICKGDVNGDGWEDFYVGGAKDQPGRIFIQGDKGFSAISTPAIKNDKVSEDVDCIWFDAENDGDVDLYVASGGSELPASSSALQDRLYINDGNGEMSRYKELLVPVRSGFEATGTVEAADYDNDGDIDLFIGSRFKPFSYGIPVDGHLLLNDGSGGFKEATDSLAPDLRELGMITDAEWADTDGDGDADLIVSGEWMRLAHFENEEGKLVRKTSESGLKETSGWWKQVTLTDLDGDGDQDLVGANYGLNSQIKASPDKPVQMWMSDFDGNGSFEHILATYEEGKVYPLVLRHDLIEKIPSLKNKYPTYKSYANETVEDIFSKEQLNTAIHLKATELRSMVGWNDGSGRFDMEPLPPQAQLSPLYSIKALDIDSQKGAELLLGGNLFEVKPQIGRYAASYGSVLKVNKIGETNVMKAIESRKSGLFLQGQIRDIETIKTKENTLILITRNDDELQVYKK